MWTFDIICVTDRKACRGDFLKRIEDICKAGVPYIILREKDLLEEEYISLLEKVYAVCKKYKTKLFAHTYTSSIEYVNVDGIHLSFKHFLSSNRQKLKKYPYIGVSCHGKEEIKTAYEAGASYVLAGNIYETGCKEGKKGYGLGLLKEYLSFPLPVYPIGGVTPQNLGEIKCAGAYGAAVMSSFMQAEDIGEFVKICNISLGQIYKLYAITQCSVPEDKLYKDVEAALKGGITCLQLREKDISKTRLIKKAKTLHKLCTEYGVPLIINDFFDIAIKYADGVHLGSRDMQIFKAKSMCPEGFIIGATAKTYEAAIFAQNAGASYLGVGAVFPSGTKKDAVRITKEDLKTISSGADIPVVAIGGIDEDNMLKISACGISGVAISGALFCKDDIEGAAKCLLEKAVAL